MAVLTFPTSGLLVAQGLHVPDIMEGEVGRYAGLGIEALPTSIRTDQVTGRDFVRLVNDFWGSKSPLTEGVALEYVNFQSTSQFGDTVWGTFRFEPEIQDQIPVEQQPLAGIRPRSFFYRFATPPNGLVVGSYMSRKRPHRGIEHRTINPLDDAEHPQHNFYFQRTVNILKEVLEASSH